MAAKTASKDETEFRVAVVSDIHAHDVDGDDAPSCLNIKDTDLSTTSHPIEGLVALINEKSLKADMLVCAGDLADKAKPDAIQYAWGAVSRIQKALGATQCVATAGNHDVDSRHKHNDHDAKGFLQQLNPLFPVKQQAQFDKYWSRHFAIYSKQFAGTRYRIVTLNSAAYHGEEPAKNGTPEFEHGRISKWTLKALKTELENATPAELRILVCHHPPHHHSEHGLLERDTMKGGQELLDLLESDGEWVVIHGHKHHPKISNASGKSNQSPVVFAAGALCGGIWREVQGEARNQFYILSFPLHLFPSLGLVGQFNAWDWTPPHGWKEATARSGLPYSGGFGTREKPVVLAEQISRAFKGHKKNWSELCSKTPKLRYLMPGDLSQVRDLLRDKHDITSFPEGESGEIQRLERSVAK